MDAARTLGTMPKNATCHGTAWPRNPAELYPLARASQFPLPIRDDGWGTAFASGKGGCPIASIASMIAFVASGDVNDSLTKSPATQRV